jgi:hypothetical protein
MATIVLLSCTKSKTPYEAPAQELYSASPMFQKTLEYGKTLKPDKMFILSAKHHLVNLNQKLKPYDLTLKDFTAEEKEKWGEEVYREMKQRGINPDKNKFIFLAGSEYVKPLLKYIPESNVETPMGGKRFGQRLKWLNSQLNKLQELFIKIKNQIYEIIKK